jgi:CHAT domain-containing protein
VQSEGLLLAQWADAEAAGDSAGASAKLARIRAIANALAAFHGEHLLDDATTAVERSTGPQRSTLIEAHRMYRDAARDYSQRRLAIAEAQFRKAAEQFRRAGSPMADMASYRAACTTFDQRGSAAAREELMRLRSSIDRNRHRALDAHILWELSVAANADGDWSSGASDADAAGAIFRALDERTYAAFMDNAAAVAYEMMGDRDLAWSRRVPSFLQFDASGDYGRIRTALHGAAMTLAALDQNRAAAALIDLMIDDAHADPAQLAATLSDRARDAIVDGDTDAARHLVAEARLVTARVSDLSLRETVRTEIDLADSMLLRDSNPHAAAASLSHTIAFIAGGRLSFLLPEAYLQRGRALRSMGDQNAALADYSAALREVERQRNDVRDAGRRRLVLDAAARIVEETVDLQIARGAGAEAFAVADSVHTVLQAESGPSTASGPRLPHGVAVLEYVVLPRAVALFCLTSAGVTARRIDVDRRELVTRIDLLAEKIRRRADVAEIRGAGAPLYRLLIAPARDQLAGLDEIVIVPDRQLHALPFAALWNEGSGRYLTEEVAIRFASSASAGPTATDLSLSPALVVADPPTTRWPSLPASREEAARIASLYGAAILQGEAATRAAFLDAAKRSALIHFAGHADSDASDSYGAMAFAATSTDSGILGSPDIARLSLAKHPLVVLAACGTFRGNAVHVSGMSSLAQSFLIAGARGVVGTLWEVDDDVSALLFSRFHQFLRAGASAARALRAVQVELIHDPNPRLQHPATWAPVQYLSTVRERG